MADDRAENVEKGARGSYVEAYASLISSRVAEKTDEERPSVDRKNARE
jgi:hypothetical protein